MAGVFTCNLRPHRAKAQKDKCFSLLSSVGNLPAQYRQYTPCLQLVTLVLVETLRQFWGNYFSKSSINQKGELRRVTWVKIRVCPQSYFFFSPVSTHPLLGISPIFERPPPISFNYEQTIYFTAAARRNATD